MTIAFVHPHYCRTPHIEGSSSTRIKDIASLASQKATEAGASHSVITHIAIKDSPPNIRAAHAGLNSDEGIDMIRCSVTSDDCTILIGSPREVTSALVRLGITAHGAVDYSIALMSATLTSLRAA